MSLVDSLPGESVRNSIREPTSAGISPAFRPRIPARPQKLVRRGRDHQNKIRVTDLVVHPHRPIHPTLRDRQIQPGIKPVATQEHPQIPDRVLMSRAVMRIRNKHPDPGAKILAISPRSDVFVHFNQSPGHLPAPRGRPHLCNGLPSAGDAKVGTECPRTRDQLISSFRRERQKPCTSRAASGQGGQCDWLFRQ